MSLKCKVFSICQIFLFFFAFGLRASDEQHLKESANAALAWLKLIDEGHYDKSWERGSLTFRLTIPKNRWISLMTNIRKPLGRVKSRKVLDQRVAKDPEGLPKGDYMVMFYGSSFSNRESAQELVTLVLESDGTWRVLTYQFQ